MKKLNYGKILGFFLVGACMVVGSSSCTKDDGALSVSATANIMIVNGAEGSAPQDYYSDTSKVNATAVAYAQNSGYTATKAGSHQGQFRNSGTTTATATGSVVFESGKNYTVYFGGSASSSSTTYSEDDMSAPPSGKAKVRFINLSSAAATAVDFGVTGSTKIVSGLAYQTASAYQTVDANTSFSFYLAGSSTAALTIPTTVQAGKIYTIFISGSTTATLSYHVIAQN